MRWKLSLALRCACQHLASAVHQQDGCRTRRRVFAAGLDGDVVVTSYIVALTSPPDARYSPLTKAPAGPAPPSSFDQVRALVLPVTPEATIAKVICPVMILFVTHMPVSPKAIQPIWHHNSKAS